MSLNRVYILAALGLAIAASLAWHNWVVSSLQKRLVTETARAVSAENALAAALDAKARLEQAFTDLEGSVKKAQQARTVIYKEVQKEVAKDEASRDWYNAPLPAGISKLLKGTDGKGN